jgi:large subunit ribosomal protein L9
MSGVASKLEGVVLTFPARASETGKLYGSITTQMIGDALAKKTGTEVERRQIDTQPLRILGEHTVLVRLTVDLIPTIRVIVHREGEAPHLELDEAVAPEPVEDVVEEEAAPEVSPEVAE